MTTSVQLLSTGTIDFDLHYGIHAKDWWWQTPKKVNKSYKDNEFCPGYCCQCEEISGEVEKNPTDAVSKLYQKINPNSTRKISGAEVLGFELDEVIQELLLNIEFRSYSIQIENNINLFICGLRSLNNNALCGAGNGYVSTFNYTYKKNYCTFFQKIIDDKFVVEIWFENDLLKTIKKKGPNDAWKEVGILVKLEGKKIAGLDNDIYNKNNPM
nr:11721_t:CDS:2 [Entrophospora candida]